MVFQNAFWTSSTNVKVADGLTLLAKSTGKIRNPQTDYVNPEVEFSIKQFSLLFQTNISLFAVLM